MSFKYYINSLRESELNQNLLNWHKDSVDETKNADGSPMVFYHGTNADIKNFSLDFVGNGNDQHGSGFYFTNKSVEASGYANGVGASIYPVYVKLSNPIIIKNGTVQSKPLTRTQVTKIIQDADEDGLWNWGDISSPIGKINAIKDAVNAYYSIKSPLEQLNSLSNDFYRSQEGKFLQVTTHRTGYDGVVIDFEQGNRHIVAFNPNQIKSIHNKGTFNPSSNNILESQKVINKDQRNQNLLNWHKDSHPLTKNADGSPKVFYHGTGVTAKFNVFNTKDSPAWFTSNKSYAQAFTIGRDNPRVIDTYIHIKNPIFVGNIDGGITKDSLQRLSNNSGISIEELEEIRDIVDGVNIFKITNNKKFIDIAKSMGYDSIEAVEGKGTTTIGVFNPNQIKSVNNKGTFNPSSNNILESQKVINKDQRNQNLLNWHKDSHPLTKNADGSPKVFYHGTKASFDKFNPDMRGKTDAGWYGKGYYFTTKLGDANYYAGEYGGKWVGKSEPVLDHTGTEIGRKYADDAQWVGNFDTGSNIMPVYLKMKNPKIINERISQGTLPHYQNQAELIKQGYDGAIIKRFDEDGLYTDEAVVFNPNQIKSIHNKGTFNPSSNNILESQEVIDKDQRNQNLLNWHKYSNPLTKNADGSPKVFYHGTGALNEFDIFKGKMFYFTDNKSTANGFSEDASFDKIRGLQKQNKDISNYYDEEGYLKNKIYSAYLNLKKPFVVEADSNSWDSIPTPKEMGKSGVKTTDQISKWAMKNGFDGVIFKNIVDGSGYKSENNFVVFNPNQIKSIHNKGTFNPSSNNILESQEVIDKDQRNQNLLNWHKYSNPLTKNADGSPKVFYHATDGDFNTFEMIYPKDAAGNFKGAYFVDNMAEAKDYGKNIKEVYVKLEKPLVGNPYEEYAKAKGLNYSKDRFSIKKADVEQWIKEEGYDGIVRPKGSQYNLEGQEVVAFKPNQIKSIHNKGTFNSSSTNILESITAYHGTPHDVDRFSIEKIGSGEGAQAFGYGLYFAGDKEVAHHYKTKLSDNDVLIDGVPSWDYVQKNNNNYIFSHIQQMFQEGLTKEQIITRLEKNRAGEKADGNKYFSDKQYQQAISTLEKASKLERENKGNLYKVELKPKEYELLDWDKSLSEQPYIMELLLKQDKEYQQYKSQLKPEFRKLADDMALGKYDLFADDSSNTWQKLNKNNPDLDHNEIHDVRDRLFPNTDDMDWLHSVFTGNGSPGSGVRGGGGADLYNRFANRLGQKGASEYLYKLGIRGIKYLDGTSRNKGEGLHNYVIFSDKDVVSHTLVENLYKSKHNKNKILNIQSFKDWLNSK